MSKPTAETHSYSDLGGYEPYEDTLGEMVRDFTLIGRCNAKSEVRRRILAFAEDYHQKKVEESLPPATTEAMRIFQMNRGDFEAECIKRGLEPLAFAQWVVFHWHACHEPMIPLMSLPQLEGEALDCIANLNRKEPDDPH